MTILTNVKRKKISRMNFILLSPEVVITLALEDTMLEEPDIFWMYEFFILTLLATLSTLSIYYVQPAKASLDQNWKELVFSSTFTQR